MKRCSFCSEEKELSEFYSQAKARVSGEKYIYYQPYCKVCVSNKFTKWSKDNRDRKLEQRKKFNTSEKGRKIREKYNQKYRDDGRYIKWQHNNKEKLAKYNNEHMNKKHEITNEEWIRCKEFFNFSCAYCGFPELTAKEQFGHNLHKEHAINNGSNNIANCVPACRRCNSSKRTEDYFNWYKKTNKFFSSERLDKINDWLFYEAINL